MEHFNSMEKSVIEMSASKQALPTFSWLAFSLKKCSIKHPSNSRGLDSKARYRQAHFPFMEARFVSRPHTVSMALLRHCNDICTGVVVC
jgi:hypothetical protein